MKLRALGVELDVDLKSLSPEQRNAIIREWSECLVEKESSSTQDAAITVSGPGDEQTNYGLHRSVTQHAIAKQIGKLHMFHSCAVADDCGSVIGFVARSGTGKTTAAQWLAKKYRYITDETLACDSDGKVYPFPKPLSIKKEGESGKLGQSPLDAGLRTLAQDQPLILRALVLLQRDEDRTEPPELEAIPVHEAIGHIAPETSSLLAVPHPLSTLAELLSRSGGPWALQYRDIEDCDHLIDDLFERIISQSRQTADVQTWTELGPGPIAQTVREQLIEKNESPRYGYLNKPTRISPRSRVERRPWSDALQFIDSYYVISTDIHTVVLSALGGYLWEQCKQPISVKELTAKVQGEFGDNSNAETLVVEALQSLFDADLIDAVGEDD